MGLYLPPLERLAAKVSSLRRLWRRSARPLRERCAMSRTRSLCRRRWAARRPGVQATERSHSPSLDTLPWQARVSRGRPCGALGSRNGASPTVTPSRVTLQRSAGPALSSTIKHARSDSNAAGFKFGVARGEWAASKSHTLPQGPRQTGLPGPTPCCLARGGRPARAVSPAHDDT